MRKTIFFCNLISSVVILTLSFTLWLVELPMTGSPFHFLMNMVGIIVLAWSLFEMRDIHHADDLFENSEVVE